jgi:type I restriction enzyme S subunit
MNWELVKLGEVFKVTSGGTPNREKGHYFENGTIPWVKTGDLKGKYVKIPQESITQEALKNSSAKVFPEKTVLLAMYGATIGACSILPFEAATNQACAALLPSEKCDSDYLYYYFLSIRNDLIKKGVGGAQPNISGGIIKDIKIPLPPLATQKKIVAILDAADAHHQKTKQLLAKYDELAQSIFLEMFGDPVTNPKGWEVKKLEEVCEKITDGTHHSPESKTEGAPYVTAKHVKPFKLNFLSKPTYISWQDHEAIYKRCSPKKGDVLYIKDGATTGIACINTFKEEISLLSSLALIQTKRHLLNPDFLCFWLNYENMKAQLLTIWMSGAAIQRFTLKKIKSFEIIIPPIEMQERFSLIINENEKSKSIMNKEIKESEHLFNSLLQKAFKGELVK